MKEFFDPRYRADPDWRARGVDNTTCLILFDRDSRRRYTAFVRR